MSTVSSNTNASEIPFVTEKGLGDFNLICHQTGPFNVTCLGPLGSNGKGYFLSYDFGVPVGELMETSYGKSKGDTPDDAQHKILETIWKHCVEDGLPLVVGASLPRDQQRWFHADGDERGRFVLKTYNPKLARRDVNPKPAFEN